MVVHNLDVGGFAVLPYEANPILVIDPDTVLASAVKDNHFVFAQVVSPRGLRYYWEYRRALWVQIEKLELAWRRVAGRRRLARRVPLR
jgi:hypothetical protein